MPNSIENLDHHVGEVAKEGAAAAERIVERIAAAGTPYAVDHMTMSFMFGFAIRFVTTCQAKGIKPPTPMEFVGYMIASMKGVQMGALAWTAANGDSAKFEEKVAEMMGRAMESQVATTEE